MERTFLLAGLDCPHCSAEIERGVSALPGVSAAHVNLMAQTLSVDADDGAQAGLSAAVQKIVHEHEPDVAVSEPHAEHAENHSADAHGARTAHDSCGCGHDHGAHGHNDHGHEQHAHCGGACCGAGKKHGALRARTVRLAAGAALYLAALVLRAAGALPAWLSSDILVAAYLALGCDVLLRALRSIARGRVFSEHFLMSVSTVGAFAIGEYPEAVAVMLFYQLGELFQDMAVARSRSSIAGLVGIRPRTARVERGGAPAEVPPETVAVGERILVKAGERIPLDGTVLEGSATLDTSALTGEPLPRAVSVGSAVLAGCISTDGALVIRAEKAYKDSAVAKIIDLVENAAGRKARTEQFITVFARWYTPAVVGLAAALALIPPLAMGGEWAEWLRRAFTFLVISCPCALVISIPLTFFGGIGAAARHGVLVKGANFLEALSSLGTVVFDKTGTLTRGEFRVARTEPAPGFSAERLLELAALAESRSNHPLARSVLAAYGKRADGGRLTGYREIPGQGITADDGGVTLAAGNAALMASLGISTGEPAAGDGGASNEAGTAVHVAYGGRYAGKILAEDTPKEDSARAVAALRARGVAHVAMLTGDNEAAAGTLATSLGIDSFRAGLLPHEKVDYMEEFERAKKPGTHVAFVGDGINDAPVLARADVGVAMGALGSDAAIEAADVVLMTDEPSKLAEAVDLARAVRAIVVQNIVFALGIKGAFLALGALGMASMWQAVFGDVGVMVLAVLNAMRALKK